MIESFFKQLTARTKISIARRDTLIMNTFREQALSVMCVDDWNRVLARCDKYAADMCRKGRL